MTGILGLTMAALVQANVPGSDACPIGLYQSPNRADQVAISAGSGGSLRYTYPGGRRGTVGKSGDEFSGGSGGIRSAAGRWANAPLRLTQSSFKSHGQTLNGVLIEPATPGPHPLV